MGGTFVSVGKLNMALDSKRMVTLLPGVPLTEGERGVLITPTRWTVSPGLTPLVPHKVGCCHHAALSQATVWALAALEPARLPAPFCDTKMSFATPSVSNANKKANAKANFQDFILLP